MPSSSFARTNLADDTLRRLDARRSEHDQATRSAAQTVPGRHLLALESHAENALVDSIAYTESFCSERLKLIATVDDKDVFNWQGREKAWRKHSHLKLSDAGPDWSRLRGYIEIRNAIQHGLGRLTDFQISGPRRQDTLDWFRATGAYLDGDQIRLTNRDATACFTTCTAFVTWLDTTAPVPAAP